MDGVAVGLFGDEGNGPAVAAVSEPAVHSEPSEAHTEAEAPVGETPAAAPVEVESSVAAAEQQAEAREGDITAEEVIEEMIVAIAVDELVGNVILAFSEEEEDTSDALPGQPYQPFSIAETIWTAMRLKFF
jgi:hypothetical protein